MSRKRLDAILAERGLFETRSRAAAAVLAGDVRLGDDGRRAEKPGQMVADDVAVEVADKPRFVSRGGQKLANALDVAYGELDWKLRNDSRVTVIERRNAREIEPDELPYSPDLVVADLSFISLTKVLPRLLEMTAA